MAILFVQFVQRATNDKTADLTCSSTNFIEFCIPQVAAGGVVVYVAIAT
jgi:hypothetical protein